MEREHVQGGAETGRGDEEGEDVQGREEGIEDDKGQSSWGKPSLVGSKHNESCRELVGALRMSREGEHTESEIVSGSVVLVVDITDGKRAQHVDSGRSSHD